MKNILVMFVAVFAVSCFSPASDDGFLLEPKLFAEKLKETPDAVLIDVRTPGEVAQGIIEGAININLQGRDFSEKMEALDKNGQYFVYCKMGGRSGAARKKMLQMGFVNVYDLKGGYNNWSR